MGQSFVEKIAQRFAVDLPEGYTVRAGDFLTMRPAHVMTHDNTAAVIPKFTSMGAGRISRGGQRVASNDLEPAAGFGFLVRPGLAAEHPLVLRSGDGILTLTEIFFPALQGASGALRGHACRSGGP